MTDCIDKAAATALSKVPSCSFQQNVRSAARKDAAFARSRRSGELRKKLSAFARA
jgi:hypothetical protein